LVLTKLTFFRPLSKFIILTKKGVTKMGNIENLVYEITKVIQEYKDKMTERTNDETKNNS
jgi:hypothetical protein